jgi:quinol monooxygenase YgiN
LFLLIEVYADDAALEAHRKSAHYLQFREDVNDWVVERKWWFWDVGRTSGARATFQLF